MRSTGVGAAELPVDLRLPVLQECEHRHLGQRQSTTLRQRPAASTGTAETRTGQQEHDEGGGRQRHPHVQDQRRLEGGLHSQGRDL